MNWKGNQMIYRSKVKDSKLPGHCCRWPVLWSWACWHQRPSLSSAAQLRCPEDSGWPSRWAPWEETQRCRRRSSPWCSVLQGLPPCPQGLNHRWLMEPETHLVSLTNNWNQWHWLWHNKQVGNVIIIVNIVFLDNNLGREDDAHVAEVDVDCAEILSVARTSGKDWDLRQVLQLVMFFLSLLLVKLEQLSKTSFYQCSNFSQSLWGDAQMPKCPYSKTLEQETLRNF